MIERFIRKTSGRTELQALKEALGAHPDWEYVVSELPYAWHVKIDRGGETFDEELAQVLAYPDPRLAYEVEVIHVDRNSRRMQVKRGSHEHFAQGLAKKQVRDKAVLMFLEGNRSKPVIMG